MLPPARASAAALLLVMSLFATSTLAIYRGSSVYSAEAVSSFVRFGPIRKSGRLVCGGVLITWKHVLTAAHCRLKPGVHRAYLGSTTIEDAQIPVILNISRFDVHSSFQRRHLTSDVALVTLRRAPAKHTLKLYGIHPIRIDWDVSRSAPGRKMFAIGFGVTRVQHRARPSPTLRNGTVYKLDTETCVNRWYRAADRPAVLCAQSPRTTTVCSGDSGGPMVVYKSHRSGRPRLVLMGIISAVVCRSDGKCCNPGAPVLSMNIEPYRDWIEYKVGRYRRW